jgi:hypothetical protein
MTDTNKRETIFISKATPGDDQFVLWLAPRLEAAGFKVFADIFDLDAGDEWRGKLTAALQTKAIKMLLCCSDETLARRGVREEIAIAEDLTKQLQDPNFIIPLKVRTFKKLFGIGGLQYVDFESGWAKGLASLLKALEKQQVPLAGGGIIQAEWYAYLRRRAVEIETAPEVLTSNWLRIMGMPDKLNHLIPQNRANEALLRKLGASFEFPMVEFGGGFLSFASTLDLVEHFVQVGPFRTEHQFDVLDFLEKGSLIAGVESRDAKSMMVNLLRQAWEKHCTREGFLPIRSQVAFHFMPVRASCVSSSASHGGARVSAEIRCCVVSLARRYGNTVSALFLASFLIPTCVSKDACCFPISASAVSR